MLMPRESIDGVRKHVIITRYQLRDLKQIADETGMPVAEHIRRALDFYIASVSDKIGSRK